MIVDLLPNEDQAAIRDSVAAFLARELPIARLHDPQAFGAGAERAQWNALAELGVFGLGLSEAQGGAGFDLPEQVTVAQEFGRHLVSPTVLATMLATRLAEGEALDVLVAGRAVAAFANPMPGFSIQASGSARVQMLDAEGADYALVWTDEGAGLYPAPRAGRRVEALDETVSLELADLDLEQPVARVSGPDLARRGGLLISAYLSGLAQASLAMSVEYAKTREQFGQPIGAFQAIKHYCAEMARRAEAATAQTFYATLDAVNRQDDAVFEAAAARLLANEAAVENGRFNIQIHGAMGFTYEADAHLYLKRALLASAILSHERIEQARVIAAGPD